jgi:serine/threonine protein kinase
VHFEGILHRDIKPDNFLLGAADDPDTIFVIDFGLSKKYLLSSGEHIPFKAGKGMTGTARYVSIATHRGLEQSRRDDLESLGHVLLYFLKGGSLPWQGLPGRSRTEKYAAIKQKKMATTLQDLCKGKPYEFECYMEMCRQLKFNE